MERRERTYRGLSARAAIGYLEGLGGEQVDDLVVVGTVDGSVEDEPRDPDRDATADPDGDATADSIEDAAADSVGGETRGSIEGVSWRATITTDTVEVGPVLELTELTIRFEGESATLDEIVETFSRKAMRAGG